MSILRKRSIGMCAFGAILVCAGSALAGLVPPDDPEAALKEAVQHFADLEDDKAKAILNELADFDVADAKVLLGYLYSDPLYEGRDYEKAIVAFEEAAASGSEEALFQVAESRHWPDYGDWTLTAVEESIRPTAREAFVLLKRVAAESKRNIDKSAARWRLAYLCTFGGYDCGEEMTDKTVRDGSPQFGNLRVIKGVFDIIRILRSGEAGTPEGEELLTAYVALGMADADPFVAGVASEMFWRDFTGPEDCPVSGSLAVAGRLLAMGRSTADEHEWRSELEKCFSAEELEAERADLVVSLDKFIRSYGNQDSWHLRTCYQDSQAATFGDCLIHAVRDHYFACTKLSLIDYFRSRYKIYYADSARYARCRDAMIGARQG